MARDQFPVGMRVLAVDDDPTCLRVLEALLIRCQYHVTTTNQAITALKMLRENKDQFDLVISDVHMPDMDGFKLLELVGLEMDLPVIMLSVNGETKTVMKGITHGACDYLLKPVRIEELRNIWQHVVRRKFGHYERNNQSDVFDECDKTYAVETEDALEVVPCEASDYNGKPSKKRKEHNSEDDEEDGEAMAQDGEDLSAQKKPRVVWSVDLHRKFVTAVNQLGIDKAVPKRILELMNVEKLTRENVASHLQKYRLYLKRLSAVASQQASLVAAFGGGRDPSYLRMGMFEGLQSCQAWASSSHIPALTSPYTPELLSRTNASVLGGIPGFGPSKPLRNPCISSAIDNREEFGNFQLILPERQNFVQGLATSLGQDQLQQKWMREVCDLALAESGTSQGSSVFHDITESTQLLKQTPPECTASKVSVPSSLRVPSVNEGSFHSSVRAPSGLSGSVRPLDTHQGVATLSGFPTESLPVVSSLGNADVHTPESGFQVVPQGDTRQPTLFSRPVVSGPSNTTTLTRSVACNSGLIGDTGTMLLHADPNEEARLLNSRCPETSYQKLADKSQDLEHAPKVVWVSLPTSHLSDDGATSCALVNERLNTATFDQTVKSCMLPRPAAHAAALDQQCLINASTVDHLKQAMDAPLGISDLHPGLLSNVCNFDGLLNSIVKAERDNDIFFSDNDVACDLYQLGACI